MVVVTSLHPGHPGLAHEGSRDQTNKMADARDGRRVARRVTAWQRRADWLPGARHHRTGAWPAKNSTPADVSVTTPATRARFKLGSYGVARGVLSIAPAC